jgi:TetR/AcrR family transcriptional repressor of mexJK operon
MGPMVRSELENDKMAIPIKRQREMNRLQTAIKSGQNHQTKKELEVLNVASDYFLRHGYQGTSVNAIARDSGISKESIYRYFSSKKELFEAVIAKELAEYQEKLYQIDVEFESIALDVVLRQVAESILGAVTTDRTLGLRRLIFQEARKSPDIGQYYYEVGPREAYRDLEKIFAHHRSAARLPPDKLAKYVVGMLLHHAMLLRLCAITKPLTAKQKQNLAAETTTDFLDAFFA